MAVKQISMWNVGTPPKRRLPGKGGRTVLHKRKPLRDPRVAARMALYRSRGVNAPAARARRIDAQMNRPWGEHDRVRQVSEIEQQGIVEREDRRRRFMSFINKKS